MKRILLVQMGALGDIIFGTAIAHYLRIAHPSSYIEWAVGEPYYKILIGNRDIDKYTVFPWYREPKRTAMLHILNRILSYGRDNFDQVICPMIFPTNYDAYLSNEHGLIDNMERNANIFPSERTPIIPFTDKHLIIADEKLLQHGIGLNGRPIIALEYNTYSLKNPFTIHQWSLICESLQQVADVISFSRSTDPVIPATHLTSFVNLDYRVLCAMLRRCEVLLSVCSGIRALACVHLPKLCIIEVFSDELRMKKDCLSANGFFGISLLNPDVPKVISIALSNIPVF